MTIGDRIKHLRLEHGLTQTELANSIDSTKQTIFKYESGVITNIPSDKLELISKTLSTTPAYLMGWESHTNTSDVIVFSNGKSFKISDLPAEAQEDLCKYIEFLVSKYGKNK